VTSPSPTAAAAAAVDKHQSSRHNSRVTS